METPTYLPGSQFRHPPTLPMRISSPGTQPEPPSLHFTSRVYCPTTRGLVSQGDFCISESLHLLGVLSSLASTLPNHGLRNVGHAQVPGWSVHHQYQQSTEKLITGDGCSHTPALVLVPPAQAMRHRYQDQRKNTTILTKSLKNT